MKKIPVKATTEKSNSTTTAKTSGRAKAPTKPVKEIKPTKVSKAKPVVDDDEEEEVEASAADNFPGKIPTKVQIRALKIGDIIDCYYTDTEEVSREVVVQGCGRKGELEDILTVPQVHWGTGDDEAVLPMNTDMWVLVGHIDFK